MFEVHYCVPFVQTHFDLLDIVRTDLTQLGFPREAYEAFKEHETKMKSKGSEWFNSATNYLSVTKEVRSASWRHAPT